MSTPPLDLRKAGRMKSVLIALGMIAVAAVAFALAVFLSNLLSSQIPLRNLYIAVLLGISGLSLAGLTLQGRGSWREVARLTVPLFAGAAFAIKFGLVGAAVSVFAGYGLHRLFEYLKIQRSRKRAEP